MTRRKKLNLKKLKVILPYIVVGAITLFLVSIGSIDKNSSDANISLSTFAADSYNNVSVEQVDELYTVADLSDSLGLASASDVASNYVVVTSMRNSGQSSTGKLEKLPLTDVDTSRGIIEYTVEEGENVDSIAAKYGISADQIRWSNNLKTTDVAAGTVLKVPSVPGIVYTVKSDDTIESIAEKYGSNAAEIVALNDLEISGISEGMQIVIKDGSLPDKERPEYVAPAPARRNYTYAYTYLGDTSERVGITVIGTNYTGGGQCVGYALWYRNMSGLSNLRPVSASWSHAKYWADAARRDGFLVDNNPGLHAVFQTSSGWYGHVGVVVGLNADGSIVVQETNYNGGLGVVIQSTIPADAVGRFNYIH